MRLGDPSRCGDCGMILNTTAEWMTHWWGHVEQEVLMSVQNGVPTKPQQVMPTDSAARKAIPITTGVLDYFPAALAEIAKLSKFGNDKHNPGERLHWTREKSTDHADCILRHMVDRGITDPETGLSHTVEVAWRALALLQVELEAAGAPKARGAD